MAIIVKEKYKENTRKKKRKKNYIVRKYNRKI